MNADHCLTHPPFANGRARVLAITRIALPRLAPVLLLAAVGMLAPCQDTPAAFGFSDPAPLNTNAATDAGADHYPQVTTDGAGNWVAVWTSEDDLGGTISTDQDILVSRSTDNGATWTAPAALNTNAAPDYGNEWYPQLTTDGAGNWVVVWESYDDLDSTVGTDGDILVSRSTDNGATWTAPMALNTNAATDTGDDEKPQVTTDGAGNWVAVWRSNDNFGGTIGGDQDIVVSRSTDNGATWTAPAALNTNAGSDSGGDVDPQVTTDGAGNWVAVWSSSEDLGGTIGADGDILVSRSTDNGATWTAPVALNANAPTDSGWDDPPQVTTDGAGNWVAVWYSWEDLGGTIGTDRDILVSRSTDNGATWTAPAALNTNAATDSGADLDSQVTTDGAGNWVAVWCSSENVGGTIGTDSDILVSWSADNGATWTAPEALNTNATTDLGFDEHPQVSTDGAGNWIAVWMSDENLGGTIGFEDDILFSRSSFTARHIVSVDPSSASPGDTLDVDVLGANTHFDETSEADFGPGTLMNYITVTGPTACTPNLSISWDASPGPRDVTVTTGDEVAVGTNLFTILGEGYVPPPTGLTASAGASSIFLEWDPSTGYYVTGYNVYRDIATDGDYATKLNETPVTDTSYEDDTVTPGGTYYYKVTAVTDDPYESEKSEPAWATAGEIVITMPDIRGEAGETVRLPINLDSAWGVNGSGMEIHLTYDTGLLAPIALEKTVLTEDFTLVDNVDVADGQIDIAGVGGGTLVGEGHILDILFEVDSDALLDDTGAFVFVNVVMFDWELTELDVDYTDTAIFTVSPYYVLGDVTGDGDVTIEDAIVAQQVANGEIEPTPLQLLAGDINGDGVIDSADVTLILRMVLGLPINPEPDGGAVLLARLLRQGTPHVVGIANASGYYGDTVPVAVNISDASGVAGCDLTITFDATAFEVTDVVLGTLTSGFSLEWTESGGVLSISLASSTAISSGLGDLCVIHLKVRTGAIQGDTMLNLASVKLSGEHGEDLSWKSVVTKSPGIFGVLGQPAVPVLCALALIFLGLATTMVGTRKLRG